MDLDSSLPHRQIELFCKTKIVAAVENTSAGPGSGGIDKLAGSYVEEGDEGDDYEKYVGEKKCELTEAVLPVEEEDPAEQCDLPSSSSSSSSGSGSSEPTVVIHTGTGGSSTGPSSSSSSSSSSSGSSSGKPGK